MGMGFKRLVALLTLNLAFLESSADSPLRNALRFKVIALSQVGKELEKLLLQLLSQYC